MYWYHQTWMFWIWSSIWFSVKLPFVCNLGWLANQSWSMSYKPPWQFHKTIPVKKNIVPYTSEPISVWNCQFYPLHVLFGLLFLSSSKFLVYLISTRQHVICMNQDVNTILGFPTCMPNSTIFTSKAPTC